MSTEAVYGFINKIEKDTELGAVITRAVSDKHDLDLVDLAGKHGFAFTREEGLKVWEEYQARGELPDALLEAVAGGGTVVCANSNSV